MYCGAGCCAAENFQYCFCDRNFRLVTRQSLFHETVDDNLTTKGIHDWKDLEQWTTETKQTRLLNPIEDKEINIKEILARLLEKDPWKRPQRVGNLFFEPYFEKEYISRQMEEIEIELREQYNQQPATAIEGKFNALVMSDFNTAVCPLRTSMSIPSDQPLDHSLRGMELEVNALFDCCECAEFQADALEKIGGDVYGKHAVRTKELAQKLKEFRINCSSSVPKVYFYQRMKSIPEHIQKLHDEISSLRQTMEQEQLWYYGCNPPSMEPPKLEAPNWPQEFCQGQFRKFKQPMCARCQKFCLDWTSIAGDLHYILHERSSEKDFDNGRRDKGRPAMNLEDFMASATVQELKKMKIDLKIEEVASVRFYTSHSYLGINLHLRHNAPQEGRDEGPHPFPAIVENVINFLKKVRAGKEGTIAKVLWRGLSNVSLGEFKGGTEKALMSTSNNFKVALQYAIKSGKSDNILFRIVSANSMQRGADIQWLSMFPAESEVLYPPFSFLALDPRLTIKHIKHGNMSFRIVTVLSTIST